MTAALSTTLHTPAYSTLSGRGGYDRGVGNLIPWIFVAGAFLSGGNSALGMSQSVSPSPQARLAFSQTQREGAIGESAADQIVSEIGRLSDGWAGEGTLAPSYDVQLDVAQVVSALNLTHTTMPEIHVDDDGSTSLVWAMDANRLLSLEFFGKGYVACTFAHSDPTKSRFAKIDVGNDVALVGFVEEVQLAA